MQSDLFQLFSIAADAGPWIFNRRPIEIVRDEFGFLDFDDGGRLKVVEHEKQESLAFDMLSPLLSDQTNSRVIDARHKFAKKRYFNKRLGFVINCL